MLSTVIIGSHGVSEFTNIRIDSLSRYYDACLNLPENQRTSAVRKALAISCLRAFANLKPTLKTYLTSLSVENQQFTWNETTAGALASSLKPALGKFPNEIGNMVIDTGILQQKFIRSVVVDIVYKNSGELNMLDNELLHLFGNQLEHLFDPLAEYNPEHTELLYNPPARLPSNRRSDNATTKNICNELLKVQTHFATNIIKFFEDYLICLRVKVLGGEIPGINVQTLNTIFPLTIDEIVRVNTILFESLLKSVPYGSYETLKACGMSIPYFYKACMRHEAATKNFTDNLRQHMDIIENYAPFMGKYTINRIESIINCSLHLTKIKLILERLVDSVDWSSSEKVSVSEFYESAVGTIHSFGQESQISHYDNRIFTSNGRLLVELSKSWPKELEYGWIQRRVVTIFDVFDVISQDEKSLNVVFIFNDSVVILKPTKTFRMNDKVDSHKTSIADVIMHSMVNSVPLPESFELDIVGWASIKDVYMSEFGTSELAIYVSGSGLLSSSAPTGSSEHIKIFKLTRPNLTASSIVCDMSKAKVLNKTGPFHLFYSKQPKFTTFGTVYEASCFDNEIHKSPIALYINMPIPDDALNNYDLLACISTFHHGHDHVSITIRSKLDYSFNEIVPKQRVSAEFSKHISQLYNLFFASFKILTTEMIVKNNSKVVSYLINYATTRHNYPKSIKIPKSRISSTSTLVTSPVLSQASTLKQRVSSASSVLTKLSEKFSQEPMLRKTSTPLTEPKKRLSFSIFSRDKKVNIDNDVGENSNKTNEKNNCIINTNSPPTELVTEIPKVIKPRYSFPFVKPVCPANSLENAIENETFLQQTASIKAKSSKLSNDTEITPLHSALKSQTFNTLFDNNKISVSSRVIPIEQPNLPNYSYLTVHASPTCHSMGSDVDIFSVTSSSVVKDSKNSICGSPFVESSTGQIPTPTTFNAGVLASVATSKIGKHRDLETIDSALPDSSFRKPPKTQFETQEDDCSLQFDQAYRRISSRLSDTSAPSVFSSLENKNSELAHNDSFGSFETSYTTETSLDGNEISADSIKNITNFMDNLKVSSFYQQLSVESSKTIPQLPPIIFDDTDNLFNLVAAQSRLNPALIESKRQHQRMASVFSDDWQTISDEVPSLHDKKFSAKSTLNKSSFAQRLAEITTTENFTKLNHVQQTVDRLNISTRSLRPLPSHYTLDEHDQDRIVRVENNNRIVLIECLWSLVAEKNCGPAVQKFLNLEWDRRTLMRQKLGEAKPVKLWKV